MSADPGQLVYSERVAGFSVQQHIQGGTAGLMVGYTVVELETSPSSWGEHVGSEQGLGVLAVAGTDVDVMSCPLDRSERFVLREIEV